MDASFRPLILGAVFDMDGLMFDTESMFLHVWKQAGDDWGLGDISQIGYSMLGVNTAESEKIIRDSLGSKIDVDSFLTYFRKLHTEYRSSHPVPPKPGLYTLLEYLKEHGYRTAVASSSGREMVLHCLRQTDTEKYFDFVLCGDMVSRSKPDPQIYQTACQVLELLPNQCIALEDSLNGIRSASSAGLYPIMVPDLIEPTEEIQKLLFRRLPELSQVIPLLKECPGPGSF